MDYLFDGVKKFSSEDFHHYKEVFESLSNKQVPHTLFIGCSDSRVIPNLITSTVPGELFVIRNIGNMVPKYRLANEFLSTTSAIEYAVNVLDVENIIVCGHSNCGACNALYQKDHSATPHTKKWLELASSVKNKVEQDEELMKDPIKREWVTEQLNIIEQLKHLISYPYVKEKYKAGKLQLIGWHYIIETGEIYNYDTNMGMFVKIE